MVNHANRSAARRNDLALIVSYSILGTGRVDVSVVPAVRWDAANPHMTTPALNGVHQCGPVINDLITYVGRFADMEDCYAELRRTETRLGLKRGSLNNALTRGAPIYDPDRES